MQALSVSVSVWVVHSALSTDELVLVVVMMMTMMMGMGMTVTMLGGGGTWMRTLADMEKRGPGVVSKKNQKACLCQK
ncbi:hypothetical protein F4679DRAFT_552851 [Xylaria curta]|nr:hypothetical protein F4679DRAFT_552851 [Xylaria curta]